MFFDKPSGISREEAIDAIPWIDLPVGASWVPEMEMSDQQKLDHPNYATIGGCLIKHQIPIREAMPIAWRKMDANTKRQFLNLPNFNADKFLRITGVNVRFDKDLFPDASETVANPIPGEIVINGVPYIRKQQ
jgi:hypothetical protein